MNHFTPAYKIRQRDELDNRHSFNILIRKCKKPTKVFDVLGGLGFWSKDIKTHWPDVEVYSFDMDPKCCQLIKQLNPDVDVICGNSFELVTPTQNCGIAIDFNLMTIYQMNKENGQLLTRLVKDKLPLWIIFADSAPSKLHLNFKVYGLDKPSIEEYINLYNQVFEPMGYKVTATHRSHFRTIYIMLERL